MRYSRFPLAWQNKIKRWQIRIKRYAHRIKRWQIKIKHYARRI